MMLSNPTYFLTAADGTRFVLRKKPPGQLMSKTAHAVEREFRIIKAVGENSDVPVPKVYALCEDESIIGTPFYVMEARRALRATALTRQFLNGRIFVDVSMPEVDDAEHRKQWCVGDALIASNARSWYDVVRVLARLHATDIDRAGLGDYGARSDFYPRQIKSLTRVSKAQGAVQDQKTGEPVGDINDLDRLTSYYAERCPRGECTIVHGDFKLDNMVRAPLIDPSDRRRSSTRPSRESSACSTGS